MGKEPIYKSMSKHLKYDKMGKYNPLKPLAIWTNTNAMLDDFYIRPNVNIRNDTQGLNIKNSMRHIVAPALMTQEYNPKFTRFMGGLKEARDFYAGQPIEDQFIDLRNNWRGINYAQNNPQANKEEIMQYALEEAKKNYNQDYNSKSLYELLIGN